MNQESHSLISIAVDSSQFETDVLRSGLPVLVAFWTPWSRPCEVMRPVVEAVSREGSDFLKVVAVNADDHPDLSLIYGIESIPTLLLFVNGISRGRIVGTASKQAVLAKVRSVVAGES